MADIHVPFHDKRALEAALEYCEKHNATDFLVVNGDFLDCYQLSRFVRNPKERNLQGELDIANELLDLFAKVFGQLVVKIGNHEHRLWAYLATRAQALFDLQALSWEALFRAKERGIVVVPSEQEIKVAHGNLIIVHGHEFQSVHVPVNPARAIFMRAKTSTICGHWHQTSEHAETTLDGRPITTWSIGCLCNLRPDYAPFAFTKWNHGFALLEVSGKEFVVHNRRIIRGKVY